VAEAARAIGLLEAHLTALLELVSDFATEQSRCFFTAQETQSVHLVGLCTTLFVQFLGKQVLQISPFDHFPSLRGLGKLEAGSEQVELSKATPSRSRSRHSSSGTLSAPERSRLITQRVTQRSPRACARACARASQRTASHRAVRSLAITPHAACPSQRPSARPRRTSSTWRTC